MILTLKPVNKDFICPHCNSAFMKEKTLIVHMCEQKRRHLAKNEKHVQLGYVAFVRFYELIQKSKDTKTYDDFAHSPYYNAFTKFGSFISNINPLYPDHYIDYVLKSGVKLDHWCREELYEKYVINLIKTENVETAMERTVSHMMSWAEANNSLWNHYFNYVSLSRATFDIKDGKVSPWLILNCQSGRDMLAKFSDEQLEAVGSIIDPVFWGKKFRTSSFDVKLVHRVVKEASL
jgi:hypothetical protein